ARAGIGARTDRRAHHSLGLERADRLADSCARHLQSGGEIALAGQALSAAERAGEDLLLDLVHDQLIGAAAGDGAPGGVGHRFSSLVAPFLTRGGGHSTVTT